MTKATSRLAAVALTLTLVASACGGRNRNVRAPAVGIPARAVDVTGIYKTQSKNTLQLRRNGGLVLVTTEVGALSGSFTLQGGRFEVRSPECPQPGTYSVQVTGQPQPNKARLEFTVVDDKCPDRERALTLERWYYVES